MNAREQMRSTTNVQVSQHTQSARDQSGGGAHDYEMAHEPTNTINAHEVKVGVTTQESSSRVPESLLKKDRTISIGKSSTPYEHESVPERHMTSPTSTDMHQISSNMNFSAMSYNPQNPKSISKAS